MAIEDARAQRPADGGREAVTPSRQPRAERIWVLQVLTVALDLVLILLAILLAASLRQELGFLQDATDVNDIVGQAAVPIVIGWLVVLLAFGSYSPERLSAGIEEYKNVANASLVAAGLVGITCYLAKFPLSRGFFLFTFVIGTALLLLGRLLLRRTLHRLRRRGYFRQRVLVVGDDQHVDEIGAVLRRELWLGYEVIGALRGPSARGHDATPGGTAYVGDAGAVAEIAQVEQAHTIIVAGGAFASAGELRRAQWSLENHRVQVIVAPSVTDIAADRVSVRPVAGLPLVYLERPQGQEAARLLKRTFDVVGAAALLVLASPVMAVAAILVKLHDGGPVLFRQARVGRDGDSFQLLKFRSMVVDAESRLADLMDGNESDGILFKIAKDPRVTKPGAWMRRTSVDELPQLINVLTGKMSLVGPRPALRTEVERYDTDATRRLRVRPGITGLWQVSGRSDLTWQETVRLDLYYVDNWSMMQDLAILLRTVRAVTRRDGAY